MFKLSIMMTLNVSLLLILWDFPTQPFLGFIEKEKEKNPASGSSLGENVWYQKSDENDETASNQQKLK